MTLKAETEYLYRFYIVKENCAHHIDVKSKSEGKIPLTIHEWETNPKPRKVSTEG